MPIEKLGIKHGTKTFPGAGAASAQQEIRDWTRTQKKVVGFQIATAAGSQITKQLTVPSGASQLLGFAFNRNVPDGPVTIKLNNEVFVDGLDGSFLNAGSINQEYFPFPRVIRQQDQLIINITDTGAQTVFFALYYV